MINVTRDNDGHVITATLRWGDHLSAFLASMEERGDEVVIRLDRHVASKGFGTAGDGDALPGILPYSFPDD